MNKKTKEINLIKSNKLRNGNAEEIKENDLKEIIKLKHKLNDSLKIEDKYIKEFINDGIEVSSNNL